MLTSLYEQEVVPRCDNLNFTDQWKIPTGWSAWVGQGPYVPVSRHARRNKENGRGVEERNSGRQRSGQHSLPGGGDDGAVPETGVCTNPAEEEWNGMDEQSASRTEDRQVHNRG